MSNRGDPGLHRRGQYAVSGALARSIVLTIVLVGFAIAGNLVDEGSSGRQMLSAVRRNVAGVALLYALRDSSARCSHVECWQLAVRQLDAAGDERAGWIVAAFASPAHFQSGVEPQDALAWRSMARYLDESGRQPEATFIRDLALHGRGRIAAVSAGESGYVKRIATPAGDALEMPGDGSHFGVLTYLPSNGCYEIDVFGKEAPPQPIELMAQSYAVPLGTVAFPKGDSSYAVEHTFASLQSGERLIEFYFVNDYFDPVTGTDRNATVLWIELALHNRGACA